MAKKRSPEVATRFRVVRRYVKRRTGLQSGGHGFANFLPRLPLRDNHFHRETGHFVGLAVSHVSLSLGGLSDLSALPYRTWLQPPFDARARWTAVQRHLHRQLVSRVALDGV